MIIIESLAVGVLFGCGVFLMIADDLVRVVAGTTLVGNSAILYLGFAGLSRGQAPILPLKPDTTVSDPVAQALALTALVINFGLLVLLMGLLYRVHRTHGSVDQQTLLEVERKEGRA